MLVEGICETAHPERTGEVDFQDDLLVASRDAQECEPGGHGREKKRRLI